MCLGIPVRWSTSSTRRIPGQGRCQRCAQEYQRAPAGGRQPASRRFGPVHVGFAMAKIDEREAKLTLDQVQKMGADYVNEIEAFNSTEIA